MRTVHPRAIQAPAHQLAAGIAAWTGPIASPLPRRRCERAKLCPLPARGGGPRQGAAVADAFALAAIPTPSLSAWLWAFGPGPLAPRGVWVPGLGLGGTGLEVLADGSATIAWTLFAGRRGTRREHPEPGHLVGLAFATQAVFVTPGGFAATSALDLVIGQ